MKNIASTCSALFLLSILTTSQCGKSNSKSLCKNNGTIVIDATGSWCDCPDPYTGKYCEDFDCVNGLSTGSQFDPNSLYLNTRCFCDAGWTGELCEKSLHNRCGDNGMEIKGKCVCRKNFAGDRCQDVTICIHGQLFNGRCGCHYGWSGDFCDIIICHNGTPDEERKSCKCPSKYRGIYCDFCAEPSSSPPPECAEIGKGVVNIGEDSWPILFAVLATTVLLLLGVLTYYLCHKMSQFHKKNIARQRWNDIELAIRSTATENVEVIQPLNVEDTPSVETDPPPKYEDIVQLPVSSNESPSIIAIVAQNDSKCEVNPEPENQLMPDSTNDMTEITKVEKEEAKVEELSNCSRQEHHANESELVMQKKITYDNTAVPDANEYCDNC